MDGFAVESWNWKNCRDVQTQQCQITETILRSCDFIGHLRSADVSGRHDHGTEEINQRCVAEVSRETCFEEVIELEAYLQGQDEQSFIPFVRSFHE